MPAFDKDVQAAGQEEVNAATWSEDSKNQIAGSAFDDSRHLAARITGAGIVEGSTITKWDFQFGSWVLGGSIKCAEKRMESVDGGAVIGSSNLPSGMTLTASDGDILVSSYSAHSNDQVISMAGAAQDVVNAASGADDIDVFVMVFLDADNNYVGIWIYNNGTFGNTPFPPEVDAAWTEPAAGGMVLGRNRRMPPGYVLTM